jgi:hypothetical protein
MRVTVFVSYARRDNHPSKLRAIELVARRLGTVYIDDVHGYDAPDRRAAVESALARANMFLGVVSPHYLQTAWTRREFGVAVERDIPILALLPDGQLADQDDERWPWRGVPTAPAPHMSEGLPAILRLHSA